MNINTEKCIVTRETKFQRDLNQKLHKNEAGVRATGRLRSTEIRIHDDIRKRHSGNEFSYTV
jgi:hypothetical protein